MVDHSDMKLGKRPARLNYKRRAAALAVLDHLPPAPLSMDYYNGHTGWGMMLNDQLGDCTIAAAGHAIQLATLNTLPGMITPPDNSILRHYMNWAGYQPGNVNSDNGAYEDDVLTRWQNEGFDNHPLLAWMDMDPKNTEHVKQCIAHFGFVYMGAGLPRSAASQGVWDVTPNDGGSWGGHAMVAGRYDEQYIYFVTWGGIKQATWAWWLKYVDECHGLILGDWMAHYPGVASTILVNMLKAISS